MNIMNKNVDNEWYKKTKTNVREGIRNAVDIIRNQGNIPLDYHEYIERINMRRKSLAKTLRIINKNAIE